MRKLFQNENAFVDMDVVSDVAYTHQSVITRVVWKAIAILCCLLSFTSYDNLLCLVVLILPNVVWIRRYVVVVLHYVFTI